MIKEMDLSTAIKDTLMETLDIKFIEFTRERVVATMPVTSKVHQPFGILHGGASAVLAETVASAGTSLFINMETQRMVGLEINANHMHSVRDGMVTAVGTPIHAGQTTMVWDVRISDENDRLICVSRCTIAIIDKKRFEHKH